LRTRGRKAEGGSNWVRSEVSITVARGLASIRDGNAQLQKKTGGKQRTRKKPTTHKAALNPQPKKAHTKRPTPQQTSNADGRKSDDESVDDAVLLLRRDRSSDTAAPTSSTCEVSSTWASSGLCAAGGCSAEPQAGERLANATARSADDQWPFSVASWRGRPGLNVKEITNVKDRERSKGHV